ncbi:ribosomal protein L7/L12 [Paenibacillus sp. EKM202P]|uniref:ribosomal protein L7/L12 n=1 Tax=unclassified Paenibacillus TaxID=185978 RepID=UPI0013ECC78A|nr:MULTISPECIES: ribosomal protein L7/L12 [unclassified Paenibacillus]KAF6561236.1 ribosomal protein L7/L12 [Paenibacillus sp. EKM202P]KAF6566128.1 ribosomal protein L7/L12 [Paenibacillus sp. EKM207P]
MSTSEFVAIIALILSVILLFKVYRLQSRLNDLKSDIERLENRSGLTGTSMSNTIAPPVPHFPGSDASEEINERLLLLIREGNKIKAIKELRTARNLSLKDAKDYVDHLEKR